MTRRRSLGPTLLVGALATALLGAACTFEHRADMEEAEASPGSVALVGNGDRGLSPGAVARLFREAVFVGDLSLALSLLDRQATLVDELAGTDEETMTRGELLLELRRRHVAGLGLEVLETRVEPATESTLVLSRLALLERGDDGIGVEVGRAYETLVMVRTDEGWRIRHLHRSVTRRDP